MAQTQVILLERIESLGKMGDVVQVKPGYARNFLLPQKKALRASKENLAYFEAQKKHLEAENEKGKKEAEKLAQKIEGLKVALIRQASEGGQLYGSVTSRDIAEQISANSDVKVERGMVLINQNYKTIGLFPVSVRLHPEVAAKVVVNIARTPEEAEIQASTGKALIADQEENIADVVESATEAESSDDEQLKEVLEDTALEAQKQKKEKAQADAAEQAEKEEARAAKAESKAAKAAKKAAKEEEQAAEGDEQEAPVNEPEE